MIRVISWNNGQAARELSAVISNGRLVSRTKAERIPRTDVLVNLGCSEIQRDTSLVNRVLNSPAAVAVASSKLRTFQALGNLCPPNWTDRDRAVYECLQANKSLVCRTIDNGNSGAGIVVLTPEQILAGADVPRAHVYVQGIEKRREYRIHVGRDDATGRALIIDITRKVRRSGVDDTNRPFVWNHDNDFIFQRGGVTNSTIPPIIKSVATNAVTRLGLNFGAVDIIVERGGNLNEARVFALEVNTSPGMEGRTLERYSEFFNHIRSGTFREMTPWTSLPPFIQEREDGQGN